MIWLASFPRSGNTFFRNVLYEVYGLTSSTFHREPDRPLDEDYAGTPFVKTHLLPDQLIPDDPSIKSVYIVRDGRDALVSMAHHRKDFIESNSDFYINLLEAIVAPKGSFFGGWSENVRQWTAKADIVIRFEDLIEDPIGQVERLRQIMELPNPRIDRLPDFEALKRGTPKYGSGRDFLNEEADMKELAQKNFRRGKVGSWESEMPKDLQKLFWEIHGEEMVELGYKNTCEAAPKYYPIKVLLDVGKLLEPARDGIWRYVLELVNSLQIIVQKNPQKWQIDLFINNGLILPLKELDTNIIDYLYQSVQAQQEEIEEFLDRSYEGTLLRTKHLIKKILPYFVYAPLSWTYKKLPIRWLLLKTKRLISARKISQLQKENLLPVYDLIHLPLPQRLVEMKDWPGKLLVTVHDLTHITTPQFHQKANALKAAWGLAMALKRDGHFLCISNSTMKDLGNHLSIPSSRLKKTYESANRDHFYPRKDDQKWEAILNKYQLPKKRFLVTLFTLEPRKNLLNTLKAFEALKAEEPEMDIAFFVCGKMGWKMDQIPDADELKQHDIYLAGFVEEEDLPFFYSYAEALCYISFYEGFGLPPLEAMSCGTPVIYGDNSSMPEVIGPGGLAADPTNVKNIQQQMHKLLYEDGVRENLSKHARKRSFQFSWLKMAWETLQVYEEVAFSEDKV